MRSPALLCALVLANHVGTALLISSDVFLRFAGRNCFERHGATDLESPTGSSAGTMALDACEALCDSTSGCTSIVYGGAEGDCFRRANVSLGSCAVEGGGYDLYTKEFEPLACDALPDSKMLPGFDGAADDAAARVAWRAALDATRDACQVDFNASIFELDASAWTQTSYIQPQMHPMDRFFYEPGVGYTPQRWLDDVNARYGGVDSILMWPTYTNIGTDDRSQFDLFEAMPGGVAGVRAAIDELHAAGVKVLIPFNPWDAGTLRCGPGLATCGGNANLTAETAKNASYCDSPATAAAPGVCDARIMDSLIKGMDADGFNGDTMGLVPREFFDVSMDLHHPVAIEPEGGGTASGTAPDAEGGGHPGMWDTMGWGCAVSCLSRPVSHSARSLISAL